MSPVRRIFVKKRPYHGHLLTFFTMQISRGGKGSQRQEKVRLSAVGVFLEYPRHLVSLYLQVKVSSHPSCALFLWLQYE